jgi:cell division protein FtsB
MINKKIMQVLVLLLSFIFMSTAVYAKSGDSNSMKYSHSWWSMPFYQIKMAAKEANALQNKISELQRKTDRLEQRKVMIEEQISTLEKELNSIKERKVAFISNGTDSSTEYSRKQYSVICPYGYFAGSKEFDDYDFSWAYLKYSNFTAATLQRTNFSNSNLQISSFKNATLDGVIFSGADLSGSNFTGAIFINVIWGDDMNGYAICPDEYSAAEHVGGSCTEPLL